MLIIVEGCDCVGKSTFVQRLSRAIQAADPRSLIEVRHARPPKQHPLDEYERTLFDYRPGRNKHIICDRWHWGEQVYPAVLGRDTQYDKAVKRHIDMFLASRGALIVHLTDKVSVVEDCVRRRGDNLVRSDQVVDIMGRYAAISSSVPVETVTGTPTDAVIASVIRQAQWRDQLSRPLAGSTTYIGPRHPRTLILGDVRHHAERIDARCPAFGPYPATSGHYLLTHLQTYRSVGLANACDVDDWRVLWQVLGRPQLVTLGVQAHKRLADFPHGSVPHPQFIRRFHNRDGAAYGAIIAASIDGEDNIKWRP